MKTTERNLPKGYFTEGTMQHLIPENATLYRWFLRSLKVVLACKLTIVYGHYRMERDLNSLPEPIHSQEDYLIDAKKEQKEFKHFLKVFKGDLFVPDVAEQFCKTVYEGNGHVFFNASCNLNYSVYAETLLLYQFNKIDYSTFVKEFRGISLFKRKREPVSAAELKGFISAMYGIVDAYLPLLREYLFKKKLLTFS